MSIICMHACMYALNIYASHVCIIYMYYVCMNMYKIIPSLHHHPMHPLVWVMLLSKSNFYEV